MGATAGYNFRVYVAADSAGSPGAYTEVAGIEGGEVNDGINDIDISASKDQIGAIKRLMTMRDTPVNLSGHEDRADSGQTSIRTKHAARTLSWLKVLPDGTNGWAVPGYFKNVQTRMDMNKVALSLAFVSSGLPDDTP